MEVEGLLIHGAAHLFFEHKLEDLTAEFNGKIKKMEAFMKRELFKLHDLHMGEVKKIKSEVRMLKEEVVFMRKSEDDVSHHGLNKIRRLRREVKDEVQDVKKMRREVMQVKEFINDMKQHEENITHVGMQKITKINKEMKSEVKHLKRQVKRLKKCMISTKESSRTGVDHNDISYLRFNTLELKKEEVEELLAVRGAIQRAYETAVKPAGPAPDNTQENPVESDSGRSSLNLWLPSSGPPSATAGDAIQLSQSVILYVKAPDITDSDSSDLASLHWSSQEDLSAPVTRNSSFDVKALRRQSSSRHTSDDEEGHPHHHLPCGHHHHPPHDEDGHHGHHRNLPDGHHDEEGHVNHHLHHSHIDSALHDERHDSPPLTPALSEDEVDKDDTGPTVKIDSMEGKEYIEDLNAGITMKIDSLEKEQKVEKSDTEVVLVIEFVDGLLKSPRMLRHVWRLN